MYNNLQSLSNALETEFSKQIVDQYNGKDWKHFVEKDTDKFSRSVIYKSNNIEVIIITWPKKYKSQVHDHAKNGCFIKMLHGSLFEHVYSYQYTGYLKANYLKTNYLTKNDVSFISNNIGIHAVENYSNTQAVSLHVYKN